MRTTARRRAWAGRVAAGVALAVVLPLAGCAAGGSVPDSSQASVTPAPTPSVVVPSDGVSLSALGFENGPVDRVFVPIGAQVSSRVDQTDDVVVVLTSPSAADLLAFYRRTATANGFVVTAADPATTTLVFTGLGWTGTFTADDRASALLLRPAS